MIDIRAEPLIPLRQVAAMRPAGRKGRPLHVATVYRWATRGIRGVRLEVIRLGGSLYSSREAVQRFADRLSAAPPGAEGREGTCRRHDSAARAADELSTLGI